MKKLLLTILFFSLNIYFSSIVYAGAWYTQTHYLTVIVKDNKSNDVIPYTEIYFYPMEFFKSCSGCKKTITTGSNGRASYSYTGKRQPKMASSGQIEVSVKADGYESKSQTATLREDSENITTVYLNRR